MPVLSPADRAAQFWSLVDTSGECWLWTGKTHPNGYGQASLRGVRYAHRVAYLIAHGEIPQGAAILHRCDVRTCVRPSHLYAGTGAQNAADREESKRRAKLGLPSRAETVVSDPADLAVLPDPHYVVIDPPRNVAITVSLPQHAAQRFTEVAKARGISKADAVRQAVNEYLTRRDQQRRLLEREGIA